MGLSWDAPIAVVEHNISIGYGGVDTEAAYTSGEQEGKLLTPRLIIPIDRVNLIIMRGPAIYTGGNLCRVPIWSKTVRNGYLQIKSFYHIPSLSPNTRNTCHL
jgi:hypothetical protein